ncbi:MAG: hypothetical protein EA419_11025 [Wenzhouxiangella sp.]|nr:MAG: hypothetical protein EA419_11025 [Wenzhouxiangella sp.]
MVGALLTAFGLAAVNPALADDNQNLNDAIGALIFTHNAALPATFFPDPFVSIPANAVTFGTNLGLKDTRAVFVTPDDWADQPNSADSCFYNFASVEF